MVAADQPLLQLLLVPQPKLLQAHTALLPVLWQHSHTHQLSTTTSATLTPRQHLFPLNSLLPFAPTSLEHTSESTSTLLHETLSSMNDKAYLSHRCTPAKPLLILSSQKTPAHHNVHALAPFANVHGLESSNCLHEIQHGVAFNVAIDMCRYLQHRLLVAA